MLVFASFYVDIHLENLDFLKNSELIFLNKYWMF